MTKKTGLTFLLMVLFFSTIFAQTIIVDSLKNLLSTSKKDTSKAVLLCDLAFYLYELNPEESLKYSQDCYDLSIELEYNAGVVNALYKMGIARMAQAKNDLAIEKITKALELARAENLESRIANCLNVLGLIYLSESNFEKALEIFFESIALSEKTGNLRDLGGAYHNIGRVYLDYEDNENARKYFLKSLENYKKTDDLLNTALTYNSLSTVEPENDKKLEYLKKTLEIGEQVGHGILIAFASGNLGGHFFMVEQDTLNALKYYRKSVFAANQVGDVHTGMSASYEMGQVFVHIGQLDSAKFYLGKSLEFSKRLGKTDFISNNLKYLAQCAAMQNNFSKAYELLGEATDLKDTLHHQNITQKLAEADAKYETSQKEAQISAQQLEIERQNYNQNRILLSGGLIILALLVGFQWHTNRQKRKKREAELALEFQKTQAEKFKQLDNLKTKFFANISHELRTPLTLIMSPLEDAIGKLKNKTLESDLQLAHSNSKKLLNLVNEVLDLSKLEAGKLELNWTSVNLDQLTRRIFYSFQSLAQLRKIQLVYKNELPNGLMVKLDVEKLEKILNNLLSNAIKYSKSNGKVEFVISQFIWNEEPKIAMEEFLIFKVKDSGEGISEEELPKIFDRYYQSNSGKLIGGTGIGLALSNELAKHLNGQISVESTIGKGSTFTLKIPTWKGELKNPEIQKLTRAFQESETLQSTNSEVVEPPSIYQPILFGNRKPKILIVEDNFEMSNFLVKILSPHYECQTAFDGLEALRFMDETGFDLITSDVMMPEMDGFEFRELVNQRSDSSQTPFVMLTARALEEDKLQGFKLGVDDYITKPFSSKELLARIDNLLRNKLERDNWQRENAREHVEVEVVESAEHQLLKQAEQIILDNLDIPEFKVTDLAKEIGYSQRQLIRIIKKLTGFSPVGFILEIRLQKAFQLLQSRQFLTVSEVRYEVGIESAAYFTTKFKERFGKTPKELLSR